MTSLPTGNLPFLLGALVLGLSLILGVSFLVWRAQARRIDLRTREIVAQLTRETATLLGRSETRALSATQELESEVRRLRQDIATISADTEWLAGERMIEQAIQMCRDGLSAETICAESGLSSEAVRTIKTLRTH